MKKKKWFRTARLFIEYLSVIEFLKNAIISEKNYFTLLRLN